LLRHNERLFLEDSKMRFQISSRRNSDKPVRHQRIDLDDEFEVGTGLGAIID